MIYSPTSQPSSGPTEFPSNVPSTQPTDQPTSLPTLQPSRQPTAKPTFCPTSRPTLQPSVQPTSQPSIEPSSQPSSCPSTVPTGYPTYLEPIKLSSDMTLLNNASYNTNAPMCVDASNNVFFIDSTNKLLNRLSSTGRFSVFDSGHSYSGCICDTNGNIYLTDSSAGTVLQMTTTEGSVATTLRSGLLSPTRPVIGIYGQLFFADSEQNKVFELNTQTQALRTIAGTGEGGDKVNCAALQAMFSGPQDVYIDTANNIYIADTSKWKYV